MNQLAFALLAVSVVLLWAAPALAQHEMLVAGARFTVPEDWRPVRHQNAAIVESPDGTVRYLLLPSRNDFDDSDPDAWLERAASEWLEEEGGYVLDPFVPTRIESLGAARPALDVLVREGIELRRTRFVLHADGVRRRVVGLEVQAPADLDSQQAEFDAWLAATTLHETPSVSPAPTVGELEGTFAALRTQTRREWIAASDAISPLYAEDDSSRAARGWTAIEVDAYTFWRDGSRVYWGLPQSPIDSLDASMDEDRLRWGHYEPDGDRLRIWYRFGNQSVFPFESDSAAVRIDGREYARLRPVGSPSELVGTWVHHDVETAEIAGEGGRMRSEEVTRVALRFDPSREVLLTLDRERRQTVIDGTSRTASPSETNGGLAEVSAGALTLTFLDESRVSVGAYWHGDTLLLGGDAFRRVAASDVRE